MEIKSAENSRTHDIDLPEDLDQLDRLLNIDLPVIAMLAEKKMSLEEVLMLEKDSVISFDKPNSVLLDFYVNNCLVGRGQAIKFNDKFGIHIAEVDSPEEAVKKLGLEDQE